MRIALVHDDFIQSGGAESLFATIASIYPEAPIYTSLVDWSKLPKSIARERIKTSFIQKIPLSKKLYKLLLPLYPLAFETFDFSSFDLVISSTTRFSKSAITKPTTTHVCYINSTPRFLWNKEAQKEYAPSLLGFLFRPLLVWLKRWDKAASSRPDYYIANSQNIQNQVLEVYGCKSEIIYPFANLNFFTPPKVHNWELKTQNYFLVVSRLVKWKKIDLAIKACLNLGLNLKIVGTGPDKHRLMVIASRLSFFGEKAETQKSSRQWIPNQVFDRESLSDFAQTESVRNGKKGQVEFLEKVSVQGLKELYQNCQALIITQEEDFGIAAVEAQACGVPVIAYGRGGSPEIVKNDQTGILFNSQTQKSLEDAIFASLKVKWSMSACRKNSLKFSRARFTKEFKNKIETYASKP